MMRKNKHHLRTIIIAAVLTAAVIGLVRHFHIKHFRCVVEENWYNEEISWVRENGVKYFELPMERKDRKRRVPDEATQKKFLEIMSRQENLPVLVHGSSGRKRVSTLAATWLIKEKGYTYDQALEAVENIRGEEPSDPEKEFLRGLYNNSE